MALWDGRFETGPADEMVRFSSCIDLDMRMWREDLAGSRAHARGLAQAGLISADELTRLLEGLDQVEAELQSGAFAPGPAHEDIHMAVEARLTELVGAVGGKLHTARSRNDQVATDVRLWMRTRLQALRAALAELVEALVVRVEADGQVLMPGYTHLQRGQPILLGHHLLAHAWAARRDAERVDDALRRLDRCPLGAGAMAGTPHPIDRHHTAALLGFSAPCDNAMDAVSARDHLLEATAACAIAMTHLSRIAEELIVWSSAEFGFVRLDEAWTTGSSIMPQKRNPDAAELVRGRAARVIADLQALLVLVKGLPLAYNRDLQEDRAPLFHALETTVDCVHVTSGMLRSLQVRPDRFEAELRHDFLLATELADHLAAQGVPFREAHHVAGRIVAWCEERGTDLRALDASVLAGFHPALGAEVLAVLAPRPAAERRTSFGGTASGEVERQVAALRSWVGEGVRSVDARPGGT